MKNCLNDLEFSKMLVHGANVVAEFRLRDTFLSMWVDVIIPTDMDAIPSCTEFFEAGKNDRWSLVERDDGYRIINTTTGGHYWAQQGRVRREALQALVQE